MVVNVKKKIWLGTFFLFLLLLLTGGVGIFYMAKLKTEGQNVLRSNYESLSYCHSMQHLLPKVNGGSSQSINEFEGALVRQEQNITEPGEDKATAGLRRDFDKLKSDYSSQQLIQGIENSLQSILFLNMRAIQRKSLAAEKTAGDALTIIISLCGLVFLISFTFLINFPSVVTDPINRLSEAIKEIANMNYSHRIHIDNKDEFGKLADAFNEMAERLQYFESSNLNKLMFEKSRAEAVINSLKNATIGIDKNDLVLFANYEALQLLGLGSEEVVGKLVDEVKKRNDLFTFLLDKEITTPFKIVVEERENYFVKEIIEVTQGAAKYKVIVLNNITSFRELDVAKTNFIATISHELKTPLAASDLGLKLLEDERVSTLSIEQQHLVANLKKDNLRMLKILSELLNMAQVEEGRILLNFQMVCAGEIIDNAMQSVTAAANEKDITLRHILNDQLPLLKADLDKTTWVLNNLLTNAIKYSHPGSTVELSATAQDGKVIFLVKDSGPGIAAEYIPRLFERYFQVPDSKEKGSGLGLAISKEFIEAQNGKIWVESKIGQGASFFFGLPVAPSSYD